MQPIDNIFTIDEIEKLCQLYLDCKMTVLEESELGYVLLQSNCDSLLINETKELMAVSMSLKLKPEKQSKAILTWAMRAAACVTIMLGIFAVFHHINVNPENDNCIVYVAGKKASSEEAQRIAEEDVAKIERFMHTVKEQQAKEEIKVEQFMNHINQTR